MAYTVPHDTTPYPPYFPEALPEGAATGITNDYFRSYDDCMYERTQIALQQGRSPASAAISGIIKGVILESMRCVSDKHPAWLGFRPEDRWVPFRGIDTDPMAKVVRCRTKEETFSLLDYSENTYKTEALCIAAAEAYINILVESWKLNGIHFNREEWPNPSCTYCVRGDDPFSALVGLISGSTALAPSTTRCPFHPIRFSYRFSRSPQAQRAACLSPQHRGVADVDRLAVSVGENLVEDYVEHTFEAVALDVAEMRRA